MHGVYSMVAAAGTQVLFSLVEEMLSMGLQQLHQAPAVQHSISQQHLMAMVEARSNAPTKKATGREDGVEGSIGAEGVAPRSDSGASKHSESSEEEEEKGASNTMRFSEQVPT
jgi:hypothetical protein